jgi:quercetin dioxygenase-like cupin family protein
MSPSRFWRLFATAGQACCGVERTLKETSPWRSLEQVHSHRPKDPVTNGRAAGAAVTFEPGARTAWHTHPLGQTLIVTAGSGRAQRWGGPIEEIRPGDVVWFAPGEKHWHGASPTTAMTHIAVQEQLDGKPVDLAGRSSRANSVRPTS